MIGVKYFTFANLIYAIQLRISVTTVYNQRIGEFYKFRKNKPKTEKHSIAFKQKMTQKLENHKNQYIFYHVYISFLQQLSPQSDKKLIES